nr:fibronectin type III domain-containing protein [uncultured Desulfobulbus sp.]
MMKHKILILGYFFIAEMIAAAAACYAQDYTFTWTANDEQIEGYKLYYKKGGVAAVPFDGTEAGGGKSPITLGKVTTYTITGLDAEATYHFALTAYKGSGESGYSTIITIDPSQTGSAVPAPQLLNIRLQ